jgi:hypothetical protein
MPMLLMFICSEDSLSLARRHGVNTVDLVATFGCQQAFGNNI